MITPAVCLLILTSAFILFLAGFPHLSFAGLDGVEPKWDLCAVSYEAKKLVTHPTLFCLEELFLLGSFLALNSISLGDDAG